MANELATLTKQENGDLKVVLTPDGREYLNEHEGKRDHESLLDDLLSDYLDKEWHLWDADFLGCLSQAPVLTKEVWWDWNETEGREEMQVGRWWYFEPYQVRSVVTELLRHGEAIFTKGA